MWRSRLHSLRPNQFIRDSLQKGAETLFTSSEQDSRLKLSPNVTKLLQNRFIKTNANINDKEPIIIMVCGSSGSGKTESVKSYMQALQKNGINTSIISMDHYYKAIESHEDFKEINFEDPNRMKILQIVQDIKNLKLGYDIQVPSYNHTGGIMHSYPVSTQNDVIFVEGIFSAYIYDILNEIPNHIKRNGQEKGKQSFLLYMQTQKNNRVSKTLENPVKTSVTEESQTNHIEKDIEVAEQIFDIVKQFNIPIVDSMFVIDTSPDQCLERRLQRDYKIDSKNQGIEESEYLELIKKKWNTDILPFNKRFIDTYVKRYLNSEHDNILNLQNNTSDDMTNNTKTVCKHMQKIILQKKLKSIPPARL